MRRLRAIPPLIVFAAACAGDGAAPGGSNATALVVSTQPSPAAQSGVPLTRQPVVELRNARGEPVAQAGVLVTATVASGGGTLAGTVGVRTGADGRAVWTDLVLQGTAGTRALRFEGAGLAATISLPVEVGAGAAAALALVVGGNQVTTAGAALPVAPRVRVTDAWGNPVAGAAVTFEITQGDGLLTGATQLTGTDGTASPAEWRLGPVVGLNLLRAMLDAAPDVTLDIAATATVGPPTQLELVEGAGQTATVGTAVTTAPAVRLRDAFGNPVPGVTVAFTPQTGSGIVAGGPVVTNSIGVARVGGWVLGFTVGEQTLIASREGIPPVAIAATGVAFLVAEVVAGNGSSCAVGQAGTAWCWGANAAGQLGDGTATSRAAPVTVGDGTIFTGLAVGEAHACGLDATGAAWCWGANSEGQLGNDSAVEQFLTPVAVAGGHSFTQLAAGAAHTCGLRSDGEIYCWGTNANGRLGSGLFELERLLVPGLVIGGPYLSVYATSGAHTCALKSDGAAWCWGFNGGGRLGDGTQVDRAGPVPVAGGLTWQHLAVGVGHTCGINTAGAGYCWGEGGSGQLGTGTAANQPLPVPITGGLTLAAVTAGGAHSCGLTPAGAAWCWGDNGSGQVGDGTDEFRLVPTAVIGGQAFSALSAGGSHTCGRTTAGVAVCWGNNSQGQVGDGTTTTRGGPVAVKPPGIP